MYCSYLGRATICRTCEQAAGQPSQRSQNGDCLIIHAKIYAIAEKYFVAGLKELAMEKFKAACTSSWDDAAFPVAVNIVYQTTPESDLGLRGVVLDTITSRLSLIGKPEIQVLLAEGNGLALGVLLKKVASG